VLDIRANTVLPAERRDVVLHTADGLELVGELALPLDRPPVSTIVCLHPLPTEGGFMDSHLLKKASYRLPALAGVAVLRFNTRGTTSPRGTSQGSFDAAVGEQFDVAAALDLCEAEDLPSIWLVGWSFGTDLALKYGCDPSVVGAVLISPPLRYSAPADLQRWADSGKPLTALVPEHDDFLKPGPARERFAVVPQCEVVAVDGAKHLFVGYTERVLDEVVARVAPGVGPLPTTWDEG
jgi:alpha/beta superfamily hydrolase